MPPALEAVLAEVEREGVDAIVFGGDLIAGPLPARRRSSGARPRRWLAAAPTCRSRQRRARRRAEWDRERQLDAATSCAGSPSAAADARRSTACSSATRRRDDDTTITTAATPDDASRASFGGVDERTSSSSGTRIISSTAASATCASSTRARSACRTRARSAAFWAARRGRRAVDSARTPFDVERAIARRSARAAGRTREEFVDENLARAASRDEAHRYFEVERRVTDRVAVGRVGSRTGSTARSSSSGASERPALVRRSARAPRRAAELEVVGRGASRRPAGDPARPAGGARHAARGRRATRCRRRRGRVYYVFQLVGLEVVEEGGARARPRDGRCSPASPNDVLELDGGVAAPARRGLRARASISRRAASSSRRASPTPAT